MDLTGLYNAIMQLIFIITGLVSIKSLTEMITQLVGQGDALKDGADTAKEAKKMAGQATGAAIHGAGLVVAGAKGAAAVAGTVARSPAGQKLKEAAGDAVAWGAGKREDYINNSRGSTDLRHWYGRRVANRRDRIATDDTYVDQEKRAAGFTLKAQQYRHLASDLKNKGDTAGAARAETMAKHFEQKGKDEAKIAQAMIRTGNISARGQMRGIGVGIGEGVKSAKAEVKHGAGDWEEKHLGARNLRTAFGFEDGIGIKAMIKGDKDKDTAINKFLHTGGDSSVINNIKNSNKFVFNITGAKGTVKDFLDNADVLEAIEAGDTALARQMQRILAQTGAKSDLKKAMESSGGQAKATASAFKNSMDNMNATFASIKQQLDEIQKKMK